MTTYYFFGGDAGNPDDYLIEDSDDNYVAPNSPPGPGDEVDAAGTMTGGSLDVGSIELAAYNSPIGEGGLTIDGGSVTASQGDDIVFDDGTLNISGTGYQISVDGGEATVENLYNGGVGGGTLTADSATGTVSAGGGGLLNISSLSLAYTPSAGVSSNSLSVDGAGTVASIGSISFGAGDDDQGSISITNGGELSTGSITLGATTGAANSIFIEGAGSTLNAPGGIDFVDGSLYLEDSGSYTTPGGLTVGLTEGSIGEIEVGDDGDLTVNGAFNLGAAGYGVINEYDDGVISVEGDMAIDYGTLDMGGGVLNVDGDLNLGVTATHRGNIFQSGGTINVTGTATFGETSFVSDQYLVESRPDDDIATIQAKDIVLGSQSVTMGANGEPIYTEITNESVTLVGDLIADETLTINYESRIDVDDTFGLGVVSGAGVKVGGDLYDAGSLGASGAGVDITIGGSVYLMGGAGLGVGDGAALEIGGSGHLAADDVFIDAGASVIGAGAIYAAKTGTTTVAGQSVATYAPIVNNGTIEAQDGTLTIDGALSGPGQVLVGPNSNLVLGGAVDDDVTIMFLPGDDETITIDDPEDFKGVISSENFEPGDKIDLPNVPYVDPGSEDLNPDGASYYFETGEDQQNYKLQVVEDDQTYDIPIDQDEPIEGGFSLSKEGDGTLVTYVDDAVTGYSDTASIESPKITSYDGVVLVKSEGGYVGTGFVIAPGIILTAAHVVVDEDEPGAYSIRPDIEVQAPGSAWLPGSASVNIASLAPNVSVYTQSYHSRYDFAIIHVAFGKYSPSQTFGLDPSFPGGEVSLTGYPDFVVGVKKTYVLGGGGGPPPDQYTSHGVATTTAVSYLLTRDKQLSALLNGSSGGPLWTFNGSAYKAVGIQINESNALKLTPTILSEIELLENSGPGVQAFYQDPPLSGPHITAAAIEEAGDSPSGETVQIEVNFSENVMVTGAGPTLALNDGGVATYNAADSTGSVLEFDYTVGAGDQTTDLEITGATNTGAVQAPGGASIDFSVLDDLPTNLSINSPLTVTSVAASQTGEVGAGASVQLTLTMSEAVSVDAAGGAPALYLNDGATALYDAAASNPADGKLVFDYTVGADDATPNLEISSVLLPTGTTITDAAGYNADFSAADDAPTGLQVGAAYLTAITPSRTGDVTTGQTLALTLTMSQGVTVSGGAPTLSLSDGANAVYDAAASNPSAGTLVFDYTVGADDYTTDLQILGYQPNGATITDAHGVAANLAGATDDDLALDVNAAVVTGVTASPSTGEAGGGQDVKLTLTMNEAAVVDTAGGSPTLTLDDAATATYDAAASDPAAGTLVFDYAVGAGDQTPNLQVSAVNLNGATIDDAHGHAADLSAADDFATGLQIGAAFVGGVTASLTGDIFTGQTDQIVLTMSQAVTVDTAGGAPTLSLSDGATATYDAAASNPADDVLAFDYTVGADDYATGLKIDGYNANGATVTDANGVAAHFAGVSQDDLYIDVNATTVTGVAASAPSGEAGDGAEVAVTLTMSGPVVVDTANGSPSLSVGDGWTATYDSAASDPANGTLVFDYTVAAGDETPDLSVIQAYLNGATIDDASGRPVDLSAVSDFDTGLQIGPVYVDQVTPSVSGDVATGQTVQFDVALSAPVTVDTAGGAPTLGLSDGEVATYDAAASSPAADELVFDYMVAAGDYAKNLAITGFDANGATVKDANGVGVDFSGLTSSDLGLDVNATTVVGLAASPSTGAALPGQQVVLTLTLSGPVAVDTTGGSPTLYLSDGAVAAYGAAASDPASGTLAFDFTDAPGDATPDLAITQVNMQGAVIADAHGNAPDFSAVLGVDTGLEVSAACYVRGARIATPNGYVAIEDLRVGDLALTASGAARPIRWIGHRRLDLSRHPRPAEVRPVRVACGAFDDGLPLRDLWLSPGHNIAWDGALIPISALLNGVSVAQVARDRVEYWHVELDAHDVILAEGLPAESYLDTGNRTAFANGGAFVEAHPDFQPRRWVETCLPLVTQGPAVVAVKARLLAHLFAWGYSLDRQADAHVVVDGRRIEPIRLSETRLSFLLPAGGREITLRSKTFVPAQADAGDADGRELGLAVGRLWIDGEAVALDRDEACGPGWRQAEIENGRFQRRWTCGPLPLPKGARAVLVELADFGQYWREPEGGAEAVSA